MNTPPDSVQAALEQLSQATSSESLLSAVTTLATSDHPAALEGLIKAFGFNNPEVADVALTGVLRFGDRAVDPLLKSIDGYDYGARAYSIRALARLGNLQALPLLLQSIQSDFAPSVRRAAVRGVGATAFAGSPAQHQEAVQVLSQCLADTDWVIRYAALCSLATLYPGTTPIFQDPIIAAVQDALQDSEAAIYLKARDVSKTLGLAV